jgi:hypothetical protein
VTAGLVIVLGLAACSGGSAPSSRPGLDAGESPGSAAASATSPAAPTPTRLPDPVATFSPASGATEVRPDQQVTVTVQNAMLSTVQVRSASGSVVAGELDASGAWRATAPLSGGTAYTVSAQATTADGTRRTFTSTFRTLRPSSTMSAVLIPGDDWVVGVGMPLVVQFGRTVKNKDAAVKALSVTTSPAVEASVTRVRSIVFTV